MFFKVLLNVTFSYLGLVKLQLRDSVFDFDNIYIIYNWIWVKHT